MDAATDWVVNGGSYAIDVDGSNDRLVYSTFPALTATYGESTFSLWFKRANNATGVQNFLARNSTDFYMGVYLNQLYFSVNSGGYVNTSGTYLDTTSFHHFCGRARYNGSGTVFEIFHDGALIVTSSASPISHATGTGTLYIGGRNAVDAWSFPGQLDDVRIYNRSLADKEIRNLSQRRGIAYELDRRPYGTAGAAPPAATSRNLTLLGVG